MAKKKSKPAAKKRAKAKPSKPAKGAKKPAIADDDELPTYDVEGLLSFEGVEFEELMEKVTARIQLTAQSKKWPLDRVEAELNFVKQEIQDRLSDWTRTTSEELGIQIQSITDICG
jgi:hypothetical protein